MNPTTKPLTIELGGERYQLHFNLNTFEKFEEITGRHFLEFLADMQDALEASATANIETMAKLGTKATPAAIKKATERASLNFLKRLSIKDVRAFMFSAMHDYDSEGEPFWPLTIGKMGQLVTLENIPQMVRLVMQGHAKNAPTKEDVEEEGGEEKPARPMTAGPSTPASGGTAFGPSDAEILASLTPTSEG